MTKMNWRITRPEHERDDRFFIIASEDTYAAKQYFEALKVRGLKFCVLETQDGLSDPKHVFQRMEEFASEYDLIDDDKKWLVLDTDAWIAGGYKEKFDFVCGEAKTKEIGLAVTNPCFEYWLLLHRVDPPINTTKCEHADTQLREILGTYNKKNVKTDEFCPYFHLAVERARQHDPSPDKDWPESEGSHIYRIFDEIGLDNLR